jgi:hypothetical protein
MVLKFLMGVDTYTGNLRYAIDMCMGMLEGTHAHLSHRSKGKSGSVVAELLLKGGDK